LGTAVGYLLDILREFPWGEEGELRGNRSFAVHVAAMLSTYCRLLFIPHLFRPGILYRGNQPGIGKTTLAQMALIPVFGAVELAGKPKDDAEFSKLLASCALERKPYLLIDNVTTALRGEALDRFILSPVYSDRILGKSGTFAAPNVWNVLCTGNAVEASADAARRFLLVDLFYAGEALPSHSLEITAQWLALPETRKAMLSVLWGIVGAWNEKQDKAATIRPSFEGWSRVIGGMMRTAGLADPLAAPSDDLAMDPIGLAWRDLIVALSESVSGEGIGEFDGDAILEKVRELGIESEIVGFAKDEGKAFGQRVKRWNGREFRRKDGAFVKIGDRHRTNRGMYYRVSVRLV